MLHYIQHYCKEVCFEVKFGVEGYVLIEWLDGVSMIHAGMEMLKCCKCIANGDLHHVSCTTTMWYIGCFESNILWCACCGVSSLGLHSLESDVGF